MKQYNDTCLTSTVLTYSLLYMIEIGKFFIYSEYSDYIYRFSNLDTYENVNAVENLDHIYKLNE